MVKEKAARKSSLFSSLFSSHNCLHVSVLYSCCSVRGQTKMNRYWAILKADASLPFIPAVTNHSGCSSSGPGYWSCLWGLLALHDKAAFGIFLIYLNQISFQIPAVLLRVLSLSSRTESIFSVQFQTNVTFCLSDLAASQYTCLFCFTLTGAVSGWPSLSSQSPASTYAGSQCWR